MEIKNPYNFARIDEEHIERKNDVKRFGGLSGVLTVEITFLTEAIAAGKNTATQKAFMRVGDKIGIYGSTLKGLLRSTSEAVSNSCISMISDKYSYKKQYINQSYASPTSGVYYAVDTKEEKISFNHKNLIRNEALIDACVVDPNDEKAQGLCIACRIFGTTEKKISGDNNFNFAGKIKVMDAIYSGNKSAPEKKFISGSALRKPQNHHESFYLDGKKIKGRKFYYHHKNVTALKGTGNVELEVAPQGAVFVFDVVYNSLEADELALLLQTIELEPGLGHKLGMGKPLGLGSCVMKIVALKELSAKDRYSHLGEVSDPEKSDSKLDEKLKELKTTYREGKALDSCPSLRLLLTLPGENDTIPIQYPPKTWFDYNENVKLPESGILDLSSSTHGQGSTGTGLGAVLPDTTGGNQVQSQQKVKGKVIKVENKGFTIKFGNGKEGFLRKDTCKKLGLSLEKGHEVEVLMGEYNTEHRKYVCDLDK